MKKRLGRPTVMGRERDALAVFNALKPHLGSPRARADVTQLFDIDAGNMARADPGGWLPRADSKDIIQAALDFGATGACHLTPETLEGRAGRHVLVTAIYALTASLARIRTVTAASDLVKIATHWPAPLRRVALSLTPPMRLPVATPGVFEARQARKLASEARAARRRETKRLAARDRRAKARAVEAGQWSTPAVATA